MIDFTNRATNLRELMDDPGCDEQKLFNTYRQFTAINRCVSGWRGIYRRWLRPAMKPGASYRLLDIGFGGGDVPRALATWAERDGLDLSVTGIEQDPRALQYVQKRKWPARIDFRTASSSDLVAAGERFDFVISNAVLHHLGENDIKALVSDSAALARRLVIHNDLRRSRVAYSLFPLWAGPCFRNSFALADGLTSIRRSFTDSELKALLPADWLVAKMFPFRLLAIKAWQR